MAGERSFYDEMMTDFKGIADEPEKMAAPRDDDLLTDFMSDMKQIAVSKEPTAPNVIATDAEPPKFSGSKPAPDPVLSALEYGLMIPDRPAASLVRAPELHALSWLQEKLTDIPVNDPRYDRGVVESMRKGARGETDIMDWDIVRKARALPNYITGGRMPLSAPFVGKHAGLSDKQMEEWSADILAGKEEPRHSDFTVVARDIGEGLAHAFITDPLTLTKVFKGTKLGKAMQYAEGAVDPAELAKQIQNIVEPMTQAERFELLQKASKVTKGAKNVVRAVSQPAASVFSAPRRAADWLMKNYGKADPFADMAARAEDAVQTISKAGYPVPSGAGPVDVLKQLGTTPPWQKASELPTSDLIKQGRKSLVSIGPYDLTGELAARPVAAAENLAGKIADTKPGRAALQYFSPSERFVSPDTSRREAREFYEETQAHAASESANARRLTHRSAILNDKIDAFTKEFVTNAGLNEGFRAGGMGADDVKRVVSELWERPYERTEDAIRRVVTKYGQSKGWTGDFTEQSIGELTKTFNASKAKFAQGVADTFNDRVVDFIRSERKPGTAGYPSTPDTLGDLVNEFVVEGEKLRGVEKEALKVADFIDPDLRYVMHYMPEDTRKFWTSRMIRQDFPGSGYLKRFAEQEGAAGKKYSDWHKSMMARDAVPAEAAARYGLPDEWRSLSKEEINDFFRTKHSDPDVREFFKTHDFFETDPVKIYWERGMRTVRAVAGARFLDGIRRFGAAPDVAPEAWRIVRHERFGKDGLAFPPKFADEIERILKRVTDLPDDHLIDTAFKKTMSAMRGQALLSSRYHIRNVMGNLWNSFLAGMNITEMPENYETARRIMEGVDVVVESPQGVKYTAEQIQALAENHGLIDTGWFGDYAQLMRPQEAGGYQGPLSDLMAANLSAGGWLENQAKIALFTDGLKKGLPVSDAAALTTKALFNYADLSNPERLAKDYGFFFYTFMRKNMPYQFDRMVMEPTKMKLPLLLKRAAEDADKQAGGAYADLDKRFQPTFIREGTGIPIPGRTDEKGNPVVIPLLDQLPLKEPAMIADWLRGRAGAREGMQDLLSMANPLLTASLEFAENRARIPRGKIRGFPNEGKEFLGMWPGSMTKHMLSKIIPVSDLNRLNPYVPIPVQDESVPATGGWMTAGKYKAMERPLFGDPETESVASVVNRELFDKDAVPIKRTKVEPPWAERLAGYLTGIRARPIDEERTRAKFWFDWKSEVQDTMNKLRYEFREDPELANRVAKIAKKLRYTKKEGHAEALRDIDKFVKAIEYRKFKGDQRRVQDLLNWLAELGTAYERVPEFIDYFEEER